MTGYIGNIDNLTIDNKFFRNVLYTSKYCQLVVMSLKPHEEIGMEVHNDVDQFFRIESGKCKLIIDKEEHVLGADSVIIVPSGVNHNIINISDSLDLKLYTIYSPPHHKDGTVHQTKKAAEDDEEEFDGKTSEL